MSTLIINSIAGAAFLGFAGTYLYLRYSQKTQIKFAILDTVRRGNEQHKVPIIESIIPFSSGYRLFIRFPEGISPEILEKRQEILAHKLQNRYLISFELQDDEGFIEFRTKQVLQLSGEEPLNNRSCG